MGAVAKWGPDPGGQRPHRARERALRGTARSGRRDGRCGDPGRLLADHRYDRQLTVASARATSPTLSVTAPPQLACDEVHCCCVTLDVPPETSAGPYATLTCDERSRSARLRFERDQQRFIVAHGVLRELLGRYLRTLITPKSRGASSQLPPGPSVLQLLDKEGG